MLGCLVGGGGDHGGPVAVGVFDGLAGERGVVERPQRLLHHVDPIVGRVERRLREPVVVGDEAVAHA